MNDEKLIDTVAVAVSGAPFASARSRAKAIGALSAIRAAGYRIVKPDNWTLCADGRFVNKTDNRAEAIRFILEAGEDAKFWEVIEVPRTRADLLAELESMKEAGE